MAEDRPLVRQWLLLKALSARRYGATIREMAEEMNVNEKTIRRDLVVFQEAGFPLEETVGEFGRKTWRLESPLNEPNQGFTMDEVFALYLGRRFMEPLAGTIFWDAAQRAFRKIQASFKDGARKHLERIAGTFHQTSLGTSDYAAKAELIDQLMLGIEERHAVFITYQSLNATEPVTYDIHPYGLAYHRGALYLVGFSCEHKEIRHWKVNRIDQAEATTVPFQRPADFDLQRHLAKSFGIYQGRRDVRVKVRFSPAVPRYVQESNWHPSQKLSPRQDGGVVGEFRLSDTEEIKRWIMSFGAEAVVLKPDELRREIAAELRALAAAYREDRPRAKRAK